MKPIKKSSPIFLLIASALTCLTLLCTACSTYDSSQEETFPTLQSNIVLSNEKPTNLEQENLYAYIDSIIIDVINHKDDPRFK